jgi:hypothetical protein
MASSNEPTKTSYRTRAGESSFFFFFFFFFFNHVAYLWPWISLKRSWPSSNKLEIQTCKKVGVSVAPLLEN